MIQINQNQKKKNPDTSGLVRKTDCNTKIIGIEGKISSISPLAANAVLTTAENKIPSISNLVKKQIMTQKLLKLKINLLIMIMTNILQEFNTLAVRECTLSMQEGWPEGFTNFSKEISQPRRTQT